MITRVLVFNVDKLLLLRFLKVNDFNIEKAQKLLLLNLEIRKNNPEIFLNRDVLAEEFQRASSTIQLIPIQRLNSENQHILVFRLADTDPNKYNPVELVRLIHATFDARWVLCEGSELSDGEISVGDMKGFSFRHMLRALKCMSIMSGHMKFTQEALPARIVQSHFVNCSGVFYRLFSIMKPFMKQELLDTVKFHVNIETLYDHIPRELLPIEYGGTAGNLDHLHKEWLQKFHSKR